MGRTWDPRFDIPDLAGKVVVVTGGNAGIGLQTVKHLASNGAKVYYTARSEAKARYVKDYVTSQHPDVPIERLVWLSLDLSNLESVLGAAEELKTREEKVDILINNAGLATETPQKNDAGWEMDLAACHVGHFVLTNALLPLLKKAAEDENSDVRIVTLSSAAALLFLPPKYQFDFTSPSFLAKDAPYEPWRYRFTKLLYAADVLRYSIAKAANMIFAHELQRRLDQQGIRITSVSLNPGLVRTDGGIGVWSGAMKHLVSWASMDDNQGSFTSLFAATSKNIRKNRDVYKGKYMDPIGRVIPAHPVVQDEKQVQGLWENTTSEVNNYLAKKGLPKLNAW